MRAFTASGRRRGHLDRGPPNSKKVVIHAARSVRRSGTRHWWTLGEIRRVPSWAPESSSSKVDDYSDPLLAHKILANAWVGTTEIHEKQFDEQETQKIIEPENPAEGQIYNKEITKCQTK